MDRTMRKCFIFGFCFFIMGLLGDKYPMLSSETVIPFIIEAGKFFAIGFIAEFVLDVVFVKGFTAIFHKFNKR